MITSSDEFASSLMIRYIIWRRLGSFDWNSFEMPKNNVVDSFLANVSPVKRSSASFVKITRHRRGDIGLYNLGKQLKLALQYPQYLIEHSSFLKDRCLVYRHYLPTILILLIVTHVEGEKSPGESPGRLL